MVERKVVKEGEEEFVKPKKTLKRKIESDESPMATDEETLAILKPSFPPLKKEKLAAGTEVRKVPVPQQGKLDEAFRTDR